MAERAYIRFFDEVGIADVPLVGGKNASLGEMIRELGTVGVRVPNGFAVTAAGYRRFLAAAGLEARIASLLAGLDVGDVAELARRGLAVRNALVEAELPDDLVREITAAYAHFDESTAPLTDVAVRSSATAEDLPDASFAGQQETYLNVRGAAALLEACKRSFASLFTDRAISYRARRGYDHAAVALSIGVQRMVRSDLGASGVMFSLDTETGFRDVVLISASWGLGEAVVQGIVNPDEYTVFKPTLLRGARPILRTRLGSKELKLVYDEGGGKGIRSVPVLPADRARRVLDDEDILTLARWACLVETHYSKRRGVPTPMDMEWAKDGRSGDLFMLQARPETVHARVPVGGGEAFALRERGPVLVTGRAVGQRIGKGPVRVVRSPEHLEQVREGEVLVTAETNPDWEPIMRRAAAIVTDRGGRTCHAAIVSREIGLPAIVGAEAATATLRDGQIVTVSCAEGETGVVYEGKLAFDVVPVLLTGDRRPRVKVMMNLGNPDEAFGLAAIPNDGVGLVREEFVIGTHIGVHPMALVDYDRLDDPAVKAAIDQRTVGWDDKARWFVDRLAEGVGTIAAAFHPKDVIVRLSDFKTNEYARLIGGARYEPVEENPMLGFRGASRYYDPRFQAAFALECRALRKVRETMGLTNVKIMVPFCRTVEEGRRVVAELAKHGLERGKHGLELYVMCEIPSNVLCADAFADVFDGFSIGSNDLTQLVLGVDRDSPIVAHLFDERDPAVKQMLSMVIRVAKGRDRKIGICGQAPSDYPELARFLVEQGIDSLSLNPDAVVRTTRALLADESA